MSVYFDIPYTSKYLLRRYDWSPRDTVYRDTRPWLGVSWSSRTKLIGSEDAFELISTNRGEGGSSELHTLSGWLEASGFTCQTFAGLGDPPHSELVDSAVQGEET